MHKTRPSASLDRVNILLQYAASRGINLAADITVPSVGDNPDVRVPIEQLAVLWEDIVRRSGDRDFGLHLGEAVDKLTSGGILFAVMMNCATVENALEKLAQYHHLATDFICLRLAYLDDRVCCTLEVTENEPPLDRHFIESLMCALLFPLQRLTQGKLKPVEIHFSYARPKDTSEHRRIFNCPMQFGCRQNEMVFRRDDLAQPIFQANLPLLEHLEQYARDMLDRLYPPDTWADRAVQRIKTRLLCGEKATLKAVAYDLALSPRHLQNKLASENITYQTLLDQVKKEMALKYLSDAQVTVCDIAFLLGFSEQSAFTHAFKRWMGVTPGGYRKSSASKT
jgi:AraC-like DNA-binding protein